MDRVVICRCDLIRSLSAENTLQHAGRQVATGSVEEDERGTEREGEREQGGQTAQHVAAATVPVCGRGAVARIAGDWVPCSSVGRRRVGRGPNGLCLRSLHDCASSRLAAQPS
jgi:hypothetical protein